MLAILGLVVAGAVAVEARTVSGRVVDGDGALVAGAEIALGVDSNDPKLEVVVTKSRADGGFSVEAPADGKRVIRVSARGRVPIEVRVPASPENLELEADVRLWDDAGCSVRVVAPGGKPLRGATVLASVEPLFGMSPSPRGSGIPRMKGETDEQGTYRFACPAGRATRRTVYRDGSAAREERVSTSNTTVALSAGEVRTVRVLDEDRKPLAGVSAVCCGTVRRLEDGVVVGRSRKDGSMSVHVERSLELSFLGSEQRFATGRIAAGGPKAKVVEVLLPLPSRFEARVIEDGTRRPLPGATLDLTSLELSAVSDKDGRFVLQAPEDHLVAAVSAPGFLTTSWETLRAGEPRTVALRRERRVPGAVVDEAGRPLAGVEIQWRPQPRRGPEGGRSFSDAAGRFELRGLTPDGKATVHARLAGHGGIDDSVPEPDAGPWRLVLRRGAELTARLVDASARPIVGGTLRWIERPPTNVRMSRLPREPTAADRATSTSSGSLRAPGIEPGTYEIRAEARGFGTVSRPLTRLEAGETRDLGTLVLEAGVTLEAVVVDPQGLPIEGVSVSDVSGILGSSFLSRGSRPIAVTDAAGRFAIADRSPGSILALALERVGYARKELGSIEVAAEAEPLRVVMQPTLTVSGRVVDAEKRPVEDAWVQARPVREDGFMAFGDFNSRRQSDREGGFVLENVEPGPTELIAEVDGFQPGRLSGLELVAGQNLSGLEIVLERGARVRGVVLSADDTPVAGAWVMPSAERSGVRIIADNQAAISDGDGRFTLTGLPLGSVRLEASEQRSGGRGSVALDVQPGDNQAEIRFAAGHRIRGQVVDAAGAPVDGVRIFPVALTGTNNFQNLPLTDAQGRFETVALSDGTYRLMVSREGFVRWESPEPIRVAGADVEGLRIELDRGSRVRGSIRGLSAVELGAVEVRVQGARWSVRGDIGADGSYVAQGVAPGEVTVEGQTQGGRHASGRVTAVSGQDAVVDLDFGGGASLSGRVHRGEEGLTDMEVDAWGIEVDSRGHVATGYDGRFRIEGLSAGRHRVTVSGRASRTATTREVEIEASGAEIDIDLTGALVGGLVKDAATGAPLVDAQVTLDSAGEVNLGWGGRSVTSDSRGVFTFSNVPPGEWRLRVEKPDYASRALDVRIEPEQTQTDLEIELESAGTVRFLVRTTSGEAPPGVQYAVLGPGDVVMTQGYREIGPSRELAIAALAPGSYTALLASFGHAHQAVSFTVPQSSAESVVLEPEARLQLSVPELKGTQRIVRARLHAAGRGTYRQVWGGTVASTFPVVNGVAELRALPAGSWTVALESEGVALGSVAVTLVAGQTVSVTMDLSGAPAG